MPDTTNTSNIPTATPPPPPPMGDLSMSPPPPPGGTPPQPPKPTGTTPPSVAPKMKVVEEDETKKSDGLLGPKQTNENKEADEKKDMEKKAKNLISSSGGGKKNKIVATILGVLFLVGAVGAGSMLVQRNQDIREEASVDEPCKYCTNDICVDTGLSAPNCNPNIDECSIGSNSDCGATECSSGDTKCLGVRLVSCVNGEWSNPAICPSGQGCTGSVGNASCTTLSDGEEDTSSCTDVNLTGDFKTIDDTISVTNTMRNDCAACGGEIYVMRYKCPTSTMPSGGCNAGGTEITSNPTPYKFDTLYCGAQQIDIGCRYPAGTDTYKYLSAVNWPASCGTDTDEETTTTDEETTTTDSTRQCTEVTVFDANNIELSREDLSSLKAGDLIKFAIRGSSTGDGTIDKGRFTINGEVQRQLSALRERGGREFYVMQYTIPEGVTEFTIKGELHHTILGWL